MAEDESTSRWTFSREQVVALALLALPVLCVLFKAPGYLQGTEPAGADSSSHIVSIYHLINYWKEGQFTLWNPAFNLGYPLMNYYQPMSYVVTGLTALMAGGGPQDVVWAYKLWVVILVAAIPVSYFLAMQRLGLSLHVSLLAGLLSVTVSSDIEFGLSHAAFFRLGLYSALFGAALLPLAFAECIRFIRGDGRPTYAIGLLCALYFAHSFLGTALVPILCIASVIDGKSHDFPKRFARLTVTGIFFLIITGFWTVPMLLTIRYMGGWPFVSELHMHGLGFTELFRQFFTAQLTDYQRFPVLLILSVTGFIVAQLRLVRDSTHRVLSCSLGIVVIFLAGRTSFGDIVNWLYPPNMTLPLERYICMFEFFVVLFSAIGGARLMEYLRDREGFGPILTLVLVAQLSAPAIHHWNGLLADGLTTRRDHTNDQDLPKIAVGLREQQTAGRYYADSQIGYESHWDLHLPSLYSGVPGGVSLGSGYHDSLGFYHIRALRAPNHEHTAAWLRLFNIRYFIAHPSTSFSDPGIETIIRTKNYQLNRVPGDFGYFELIGSPRIIEVDSSRLARVPFHRWYENEYPDGQSFLRMEQPIKSGFGLRSNDPALGVERSPRYEIIGSPHATSGIAGEIVRQHAAAAAYSCDVDVVGDSQWLLLKVAAHPFWNASLDGAPIPIYEISPCYMGIRLPPGSHQVRFEYRNPRYQSTLMIIALLTFVGIILFDLRRRKKLNSP